MFTKTVILIIMIWVNGAQATVSEHKFNSMDNCRKAKSEAYAFRSGTMSTDVYAFCVEK